MIIYENNLNKRRLFLLSLSIVCIVTVTVALLYLVYGQWAEKRLQFYIRKLENRYIVEEHPLSDFNVDYTHIVKYYNGFSLEADHQGVDHIYFDRRIHALYFLGRPIQGDGIVAVIFNYDRFPS